MKTYVARNPAQAALARIIADPEDSIVIAFDEEELPDLEHLNEPIVLALHEIWERWKDLREPFIETIDAWAKKKAPRALKCRNDWVGFMDDIRSAAAFEALVEMIDGLFAFFYVSGKERPTAQDLLSEMEADGLV